MSTLCILDSYEYPYNPIKIKDVPQRSVTETSTLGGGYITDWGEFDFDQVIEHTWREMEESFYNALLTKQRKGIPLTLINHLGVSYTVAFVELNHDGYIEGNDEMVSNVAARYKRIG